MEHPLDEKFAELHPQKRNGTLHSHNDSQPKAALLLLLMVSCLVLVAISLHEQSHDRPSADKEPLVVRTTDVLPEDFQILQREFPGYVPPLERERLGTLLATAIESNDEARALRLLELGTAPDWGGPIYSKRSNTRAPLFRAIKQGSPRIVEELLKRGARVGGPTIDEMIASRNQFSQTPLYFAVRSGNREIVDVLLQHGALISATNGSGKTPIAAAIEEADLELFQHLIAKGAVLDFESTFGEDRITEPGGIHQAPDEYFVRPFVDKCRWPLSLMELAHRSGKPELIAAVNEQFEKSPAYRPDVRAVMAIRMKDTDTLRQMIADGYDPKTYKAPYASGDTLVDLAARLNSTECYEVLTEAGAEQTKVLEKASPLRVLVASGDVDTLRRRLAKGAEFAAYREDRGSPLTLAVRAQREAMFRFLLKHPQAKAKWLEDPLLMPSALPHVSNNHGRDRASSFCVALIEAGAPIRTQPADKIQPFNNPLMRAASAGWQDVYQLMAEREPVLVDHSQALQFAAHANQLEMCRYLLSLGASPDSRKMPHLKSPLHYALYHRNQELFQMLVDAGAKKTYPEQFDVSKGYNNAEDYAHPLYHAALTGDKEFCKLLFEEFTPEQLWQPLKHEPYEYDNGIQYFDKGNTPLFAAIYGDHAETLRLLLARATEVDADGKPFVDLNAGNKFGATALHEAVIWGASKCVQLLIAAGADVTIARSFHYQGRGATALHLATCVPFAAHMYERPLHSPNVNSIFPLVIAANIRQNKPGWLGNSGEREWTPLHSHARAGNRAVCRKLLELGADPNAVSEHGETPLYCAIVGRYPMHPPHVSHRKYRGEICLDLVNAGAKFDGQTARYNTNYYTVAYRFGLFDFCDELSKRGATHDIQADGGELLCSAVRHQRNDLLAQLIEAGADPNTPNADKDFALHLAVAAHDIESCQRLLAHGADPNLQDDDGRTALFRVFHRFLNHASRFAASDQRATQSKATRLLKLLLDAGADPKIKHPGTNRTVLEAFNNMPAQLRELIVSAIELPKSSVKSTR